MPEVDVQVVEAFRVAMSNDAKKNGGDGWELVGGPYCGSVFPRTAACVDRILSIPVTNDSTWLAVYRIKNKKRAFFKRIASMQDMQQPTDVAIEPVEPEEQKVETVGQLARAGAVAFMVAGIECLAAGISWLKSKD